MKTKTIFLALLCSLLCSSLAYAVPKSTPCKVYKTDNCVAKSKIRKTFRNSLSKNSKFLMPLQRYPIKQGTFSGFPSETTVTPQVLIPVGTRALTVCSITTGGKFECTVLTAYNACPTSVQIFDEGSRKSYNCNVDCDNRRPNGDPDSNGNCDCDIEYSTCTQIG